MLKMLKTKTIKNRGKEKGFTLIELLVTVTIIAIMGITGYFALLGLGEDALNDRVIADVETISNAFRVYKESENKLPDPQGVVNYFSSYGQYVHGTSGAYIVQGIVNKDLLPIRFMYPIPRDPRSDHYYVFSKTIDDKFFQVGGVIFKDEKPIAYVDGEYPSMLTFSSLISEYNGPEFISQREPDHLPYNPEEFSITATVRNISTPNEIKVIRQGIGPEVALNVEDELFAKDQLITYGSSCVLHFSDGTTAIIQKDSVMEIMNMELEDDNSHQIGLNMSIGNILVKASHILSGTSEINITTPTTVTAIRGTVVGIQSKDAEENETNITLNLGKISVTPKDASLQSAGTTDEDNDNPPAEENPDGTVTTTLVAGYGKSEAYAVSKSEPTPEIIPAPKHINILKSIRPTIYEVSRCQDDTTIISVRASWIYEFEIEGFYIYLDEKKKHTITEFDVDKKKVVDILVPEELFGKVNVSAFSGDKETGQSSLSLSMFNDDFFNADFSYMTKGEDFENKNTCGNGIVEGDVGEICDGGSGVFSAHEICASDCKSRKCEEGYEYDEDEECIALDTTPPEVILTTKAIPGEPDGPDGLNEWRNTNVEIEITCTDDNGCQFVRWKKYAEVPPTCPESFGEYDFLYNETAPENTITSKMYVCYIGRDEVGNKTVSQPTMIKIDTDVPEKPTLTVDKQDTGNTLIFTDLIDTTSSVKDVYFLFAEINHSAPPFNIQLRNNGEKYSEYSQNPISYTQQLTVYYIAEDEAGNLTDVFSEKMCLKNEEYNPDVPGCVSTLLEARCINDGTRTGNPARPANARWNNIWHGSGEITVDPVDGYYNKFKENEEYVPDESECRWSCDEGYTDTGDACELDTRISNCADEKGPLPEKYGQTVARWLDIPTDPPTTVNNKDTIGDFTQTYNHDTTLYEPSADLCDFECLTTDMGVERVEDICECVNEIDGAYFDTGEQKCIKSMDCANSPKAPKPSDTYWNKPTNPQVEPEGLYEAYWNVNQYAPNLAACDWACSGDKNKVSYHEKDICIEQNLLFEANFDEGNAEAYYAAGGEGSPIEDSANNLYQNGTVQVNEKLGYAAYGNINGDEGTIEMVVNGEELNQASGKMLFFLGGPENEIKMYIRKLTNDLVFRLRKDDTSPTRTVTVSNLDLPNQNYIIRAAWKKSIPSMKLEILDMNYNLVGYYQASTSLSPDDFPTILADYKIYVGGHPTSTTQTYANKNIDRTRIYHIFK